VEREAPTHYRNMLRLSDVAKLPQQWNCILSMRFLTLKDNSVLCTGCLPTAARFKKKTITNTASITHTTTFPSIRYVSILVIRNVMMHITIPVKIEHRHHHHQSFLKCNTRISIARNSYKSCKNINLRDSQRQLMPIFAILLESSVGTF